MSDTIEYQLLGSSDTGSELSAGPLGSSDGCCDTGSELSAGPIRWKKLDDDVAILSLKLACE